MKKILLSTALIVGTAGVAAAEVTFNGYGRFGIDYNSGRADSETRIFHRLRFNINAKTETDAGVTFGGRIRLQSDSGSNGATLNTAYVYAEFEGFRLEVGNSNTAVDSAALAFNSEIGITDFGAGDPLFGNYYEYESRAFGGTPNRMGVFVSYSVGDLNARASFVQLDQTDGSNDGDEIAVSADYKFGPVTVSAAYANNGAGIEDLNYYFIGAEYAINDVANVGLLYFNTDGGDIFAEEDKVTLYGNYTFDAITVKGYVSSINSDFDYEEDVAYGIGVDYDIGGGRIAAGIERDFNGDTVADAGVRFNF